MRRRLLFSAVSAVIFFIYSCGPAIPIRFARYPSGAYGQRLRTVLDGQKNLAIVAPEPDAGYTSMVGAKYDFSQIAEAEVQNAMTQRGFYNFIDLKNRKERLRQLARTQTGLTAVQKLIGQEDAVDALLVVAMERAPKMECKVEGVTDAAQVAVEALKLGVDIYARSQGHNLRIDTDMDRTRRPTGVLYLTIFLQGTIVNIETSRSVAYSVSRPYRQVNTVGNTRCPGALKAFDFSIKSAADEIAKYLSPNVDVHKVALEDSVDDVNDSVAKTVRAYLKEGLRFAKDDDLDSASEQWEEALSSSHGNSASALWNLATYKWYKGEMGEAHDYFRRAMRAGGPAWLSDAKRETYSLFKNELNQPDE
jgi:hypothetical protein